MKRNPLIPILLLSACLSLSGFAGETIKTKDGQIYKDAEVTKQDTASITVSYSDGIANILKANLPEDLQKRFGYDAAKAAEFKAAEVQAEQALRNSQLQAAAQAEAAKPAVVSQQDQLADKEREAAIDKRAKELAKAAYKNWQKNAGRPDQGFIVAGKKFSEEQPPKMSELVEEFKAKLRAGQIK